jgi:hypothetical protein
LQRAQQVSFFALAVVGDCRMQNAVGVAGWWIEVVSI